MPFILRGKTGVEFEFTKCLHLIHQYIETRKISFEIWPPLRDRAKASLKI